MEKLHEVSDWVGQYRKCWDAKFDNLETYLKQWQNKKSKDHLKKNKRT